MNEMILTFEDPQLNTIGYNLFHEAKIFNEECGHDNYDPTLYKPPKFFSFNNKNDYLLSDLINFYEECPYILFNCRVMRLFGDDINYLSPIQHRVTNLRKKKYIQPILTRLTSNIDNIKYIDSDIEIHDYYLKKYLKYKNKYKKL